MCGIAAVFLNPQSRSLARWDAIRHNFTQNLIFNEERGRAATGVAVMQSDGQVHLLKKALPALEFVRTSAYQQLMGQLNPNTVLILGHTRYPTKGSPLNAANNHPLQVGSVWGVHNGHVDNDDDLFASLHQPRHAQVDSEIIFQVLAALPAQQPPPAYLQAVQTQMALLEGKYTFLAWDARQPHNLLVVRHRNPLSLHFHPQWQGLIFSSRYLFLRQNFGRAVIKERIPGEQVSLFHALSLNQLHHRPLAVTPLNLG
jgi:glucosamine 6-phosphate synthetase-like amidotransferase/phosphosugar isomerase protein